MGAVGRESYKFTITLNANAFYLRKHTESGRVSATQVLVGKRYGIRERLAASCKFTVTLNARRILPEETQGIWGGRGAHASAGVHHPWHINLQSKLSPDTFYNRKHNDFSRVGGSDM